MIITNRELCNQKMESLKSGYNAFVESEKLLELVEREVEKENIQVVIEKTSAGCWIIPASEKSIALH